MKIHLAYQNIDSILELATLHPSEKEYLVTPQGEPVKSQRFIVFTKPNRDEILSESKGLLSQLSSSDSDVDIELAGKYIFTTMRIIVNEDYDPVYNYKIYDVVEKPNGKRIERSHEKTISNINKSIPLIISDHLYDPKELALKYVFRLHYYITHSDGVTFKFLYDIAKRLAEEEKFAEIEAINSQSKKREPLVLVDRGRKFPRAFIEGLVSGKSYYLILHLSDQELRIPNVDIIKSKNKKSSSREMEG
ncbi:MAG: hypothetical protein P8Y23_09375 [Candidatus Lokiarchaeota archaeon]